MTEAQPFCDHVWQQIAPLRARIDELPFLRELTDGSLDRDRFTFYLAQDSHYLLDYARALAAAASLCTDPDQLEFFAAGAAGVMTVEKALHERYFADFGVQASALAAMRPSPTCTAYVNHLHATARTGALAVLVAALLPCFWIYQEVGDRVHARQDAYPGNPYRAWIDTYADPGFADSCVRVRAIADALADAASQEVREQMNAAFVRSSEYEWMFWDSAYRRERWPELGV